jgi:hypothetical protein
MRVGFNPNKGIVMSKSDFTHQVIVPVHIPHKNDYFKDSFQIFQLCLESLFKTSHGKTFFTVVNNGSCTKVVTYLNQLHQENKIQEVIHTASIGKINAVLKGLAGHQFELVTISDADVLFLNHWQKATYDVFEAFPKAGSICTTPSSKVLKQFTSNVILSNIFSSNLYFTKVLDKKALLMFAGSIGNLGFYNEIHLKKQLTISNGNVAAVVGAGHYVATYRRSIYERPKANFSKFKMGKALKEFFDEPVEKKGFWRLSTSKNYTYHMGNVFEPWMNEKFSTTQDKSKEIIDIPKLRRVKDTKIINFIKRKIIMRVLMYNPIWKSFLRYKGLSREEAQKY